MTSLARNLFSSLALCGLTLTLGLVVAGCKEEEPPPPPPPPPPPGPVTIDPAAVAEYLTLDPKLNLTNAPPMECSEEEVRAILEFVSAFAAGDAQALRPRMDGTAKSQLDKLLETGQWQEETAKIVEVSLLDRKPMPTGGSVVSFNLILPRAGRLQQDWLVTQRGDTFTFAGFAVPPMSKQTEVEAAIKAALDGAQEGQGTPEDERSPDPRRRIPQPNDPTTPPGKTPIQP